MILEHQEYKLASQIVDTCLQLEYSQIEDHLSTEFMQFKSQFNYTDFNNRRRIREFLVHKNTLFLNYILNCNIYSLTKNEVEKAYLGRECISKLVQQL